MMIGKPQGTADEYSKGLINEKFVKNPGVGVGKPAQVGKDGTVKTVTPIDPKDEIERIGRVKKVDMQCSEVLVKDMDFASTISDSKQFESMVLGEGEVIKASIRCVAIQGMPATGGGEFVGQGLFILSEKGGKNRLHFAMYESHASFDAEERWMEQVHGCCCCKTSSKDIYSQYRSIRDQRLIFTTLPISDNLFDVYGSMMDTAQLAVVFGSKSSQACCWGCCACNCCKCPTCCPGCPSLFSCFARESEGFWSKQTRRHPVLETLTRKVKQSSEPATHKFPTIQPVTDKERKVQKMDKMHMINFMYLNQGTAQQCIIYANPDESAMKVVRFAATLGNLTSLQASLRAPAQHSMKKAGGHGFDKKTDSKNAAPTSRLDKKTETCSKRWKGRCCCCFKLLKKHGPGALKGLSEGGLPDLDSLELPDVDLEGQVKDLEDAIYE